MNNFVDRSIILSPMNNINLEKKPVTGEECCAKKLQESVDRCTGYCKRNKIMLKMA